MLDPCSRCGPETLRDPVTLHCWCSRPAADVFARLAQALAEYRRRQRRGAVLKAAQPAD